MKTPREIAEIIVHGIGEYELVTEAKAVARECERDLIDTYKIDVFDLALASCREWNGVVANSFDLQDCANRGCLFWRSISTQEEADEYNEIPDPEVGEYKIGDLVVDWGLSITRQRIDIFINALNAALSEVDEVEQATQPADLNPLNLPPRMNTERARKYIPKAIEAGLIEPAGCDGFARYKWTECIRALAYFMEKIFCPKGTKDEKLPAKEIEKTFNVKGISAAANRKNDAEQGRQKWRQTIDEILTD